MIAKYHQMIFLKLKKKCFLLLEKKIVLTEKEINKQEAINYFKQKGDEYKIELLDDLNDGDITFYTQGNFTDLCKGPHIDNTGRIKAIKLLNIAGAYWRGDESRKQMTRIYGVSFQKQKRVNRLI